MSGGRNFSLKLHEGIKKKARKEIILDTNFYQCKFVSTYTFLVLRARENTHEEIKDDNGDKITIVMIQTSPNVQC